MFKRVDRYVAGVSADYLDVLVEVGGVGLQLATVKVNDGGRKGR